VRWAYLLRRAGLKMIISPCGATYCKTQSEENYRWCTDMRLGNTVTMVYGHEGVKESPTKSRAYVTGRLRWEVEGG